MKKITKNDLLICIQISVAFMISIYTANFFELEYAFTAGVITLLSIQITKKQTIIIAIKRLVGYFIMTVLVLIIFNLIGYSLLSFGLFVLIFSIISTKLDISIGLVPNVVMASHFFLENTTSINFIFNETAIYFIGLFFALIVNLIIPNSKKQNKLRRKELDKHIKNMLIYISNFLSKNYEIEDKISDKNIYKIYVNKEILKTKKYIDELEEEIIKEIENDLLSNNIYDLDYLKLRERQFNILSKVYENSIRLDKNIIQSNKISSFIDEIYTDYDEQNTALNLIKKARELSDYFKNAELPKSREEFENRAILFIIMEDLVEFLNEKYRFKK